MSVIADFSHEERPVAGAAADIVERWMIVGLGTASTVACGDVGGGSYQLRQVIFRPLPGLRRTGLRSAGLYLVAPRPSQEEPCTGCPATPPRASLLPTADAAVGSHARGQSSTGSAVSSPPPSSVFGVPRGSVNKTSVSSSAVRLCSTPAARRRAPQAPVDVRSPQLDGQPALHHQKEGVGVLVLVSHEWPLDLAACNSSYSR